MKRIIALLLALVFICAGLVSCNTTPDTPDAGDTTTVDDDTTTAPVGDTPDEPKEEYDHKGYLKDNLPKDINLNEKPIRILGWSNPYAEYEIESMSAANNNVESALYDRNLAVETRFNVVLDYNIIKGDYDHYGTYVNTVRTSALSNEPYDMIAMYSMCGILLAQEGLLNDLNNLDYLDFDKPWWPKTLISTASIGSKLFYASGDISLAYLNSMMFLICNNDIMEQKKSDISPIDDVLDGTWTLSKMINYTENVYEDIHRNQEKDSLDQFGLAVQSGVFLDAFIASTNLNFININENGEFSAGADIVDESKGEEIINMLRAAFHETDDCIIDDNVADALKEGRALFMTCNAYRLVTDKPTYSYAILPLPKYNAQQENYYTNIGFTYSLYAVPTQTSTPDDSALIMEALASEGYRNTTYAYYEVNLKCKFTSNDERNLKMFDIIKNYTYFDASRIMWDMLQNMGLNPVGFFRTNVQNDSGTWSSKIGGIRYSLNTYLTSIVTPMFRD